MKLLERVAEYFFKLFYQKGILKHRKVFRESS